MFNKDLYTWIMNFARRKAGDDRPCTLYVILGSIQLISMDDTMLAGLFHDDTAMEEVKAIREMFRQKNINCSVLRQSLGMLLSLQLKLRYRHQLPDIEPGTSVSEYLSILIEMEREIVDEAARACSAQDLKALQEKMTSAPRTEDVMEPYPESKEKDESDPTVDCEVTASEKPNVSFDDIVGAKTAKEALKQFADIMHNPQNHRYGNLITPRGILLYGPPGTGKTMLAKAMAAAAEATFYAVNATDFFGKFVGTGEERIRKLFKKAKETAPSIIFIDEIDAIAKERIGERGPETYLNALMTEMEGFSYHPDRPVFVLAATNFPIEKTVGVNRAVIDPALLRRFNNKIRVDLPSREERKVYLQKMMHRYGISTVSEDVCANVADRLPGQSLSTLNNIINLALCKADKNNIPLQDEGLLEALDEYRFGDRNTWDVADCRRTAYHEAGHAYIAHLSGHTPSFVTIVSHSNYGGYMQPSDENIPSRTREDIIWEIRTALAGRASEMVFEGKDKGINTGASSDLRHATDLAINMVSLYGMSGNSLLCLDLQAVSGTPYGDKMLSQAEQSSMDETRGYLEYSVISDHLDGISAIGGNVFPGDRFVDAASYYKGKLAEFDESFDNSYSICNQEAPEGCPDLFLRYFECEEQLWDERISRYKEEEKENK